MLICVPSQDVGSSRRIPSGESRWLHKIFSQKPAVTYGSYLGGDLRQNSGGFLVRDDLPRQTTAPHIEAVPLPE